MATSKEAVLESDRDRDLSAEWNNVIFTYDNDSNKVRLYCNGRVIAERDGNVDTKLISSLRDMSLFDGFVGQVDEVKVYNAYIGDSDASALSINAQYTSEINPVVHLQFDEHHATPGVVINKANSESYTVTAGASYEPGITSGSRALKMNTAHVSLSNDNLLTDGSSGFSVGCWVKLANLAGTNQSILKKDGVIDLKISQGEPRLTLANMGSPYMFRDNADYIDHNLSKKPNDDGYVKTLPPLIAGNKFVEGLSSVDLSSQSETSLNMNKMSINAFVKNPSAGIFLPIAQVGKIHFGILNGKLVTKIEQNRTTQEVTVGLSNFEQNFVDVREQRGAFSNASRNDNLVLRYDLKDTTPSTRKAKLLAFSFSMPQRMSTANEVIVYAYPSDGGQKVEIHREKLSYRGKYHLNNIVVESELASKSFEFEFTNQYAQFGYIQITDFNIKSSVTSEISINVVTDNFSQVTLSGNAGVGSDNGTIQVYATADKSEIMKDAEGQPVTISVGEGGDFSKTYDDVRALATDGQAGGADGAYTLYFDLLFHQSPGFVGRPKLEFEKIVNVTLREKVTGVAGAGYVLDGQDVSSPGYRKILNNKATFTETLPKDGNIELVNTTLNNATVAQQAVFRDTAFSIVDNVANVDNSPEFTYELLFWDHNEQKSDAQTVWTKTIKYGKVEFEMKANNARHTGEYPVYVRKGYGYRWADEIKPHISIIHDPTNAWTINSSPPLSDTLGTRSATYSLSSGDKTISFTLAYVIYDLSVGDPKGRRSSDNHRIDYSWGGTIKSTVIASVNNSNWSLRNNQGLEIALNDHTEGPTISNPNNYSSTGNGTWTRTYIFKDKHNPGVGNIEKKMTIVQRRYRKPYNNVTSITTNTDNDHTITMSSYFHNFGTGVIITDPWGTARGTGYSNWGTTVGTHSRTFYFNNHGDYDPIAGDSVSYELTKIINASTYRIKFHHYIKQHFGHNSSHAPQSHHSYCRIWQNPPTGNSVPNSTHYTNWVQGQDHYYLPQYRAHDASNWRTWTVDKTFQSTQPVWFGDWNMSQENQGGFIYNTKAQDGRTYRASGWSGEYAEHQGHPYYRTAYYKARTISGVQNPGQAKFKNSTNQSFAQLGNKNQPRYYTPSTLDTRGGANRSGTHEFNINLHFNHERVLNRTVSNAPPSPPSGGCTIM